MTRTREEGRESSTEKNAFSRRLDFGISVHFRAKIFPKNAC